jgi:phosphoribosylanthranilate isomerase
MVRALRNRFPEIPIMRAIPVIGEASIEVARSYQGVADFLLLDSYDPSISRRIVDNLGILGILVGCLGPENVAQAIIAVRPAGVDSKTKTDRADETGKDLAKVREFVAAARLTT